MMGAGLLRESKGLSGRRIRRLTGVLLAAAAMLPVGGAVAQSTYGPAAPARARAAQAPVALARPGGVSAELADAAGRASETYPSVRAGRLAAQAAGSDTDAAKWLRFPSVSVEALAFTGDHRLVGDRDFTTSIVVDQPLYAGGRIGGSIKRAQAMQLLREVQVDETRRDVALRVTQAYFDLARAARRTVLLSAGLEEHRRLVDSISRRVEQEISPRADLELAQTRTAQVAQDFAASEAQRAAALQQLRELVGDPNYDPGAVPRYDAAVHHPDPQGAIDQALTCDPRRQRFQAEALVARADVKVAQSSIMPKLSAQYSHNEITGNRVGLVLRAQTDGGLSQLSAAEGARLRRDASDVQIAVAERELRETMALDLLENVSMRDRIASNAAAAVGARAVTDSYQRQFVAGRRTWLDVMNAVREATGADIAQSDAEVAAMASAARLLLRSCRWQPQAGETIPR